MTDPIEKAEAFLVEAAGRWPLSDDCACGLCRACAHVRALIAAARADRDALRIVSDERDVHRDVCEAMRRERDEARAERDARPSIAPEDAANLVLNDSTIIGGKTRMRRIVRALRAHARKAVKP